VKAAWDAFWYRPAGPLSLIVARALVCSNALWILLSRPDLPHVLAWPEAFWVHVPPFVRWRFLDFGLPLPAEAALYGLACLALVSTLLGFLPRISALAAAVLLYHFAPLESVFSIHTGPHFRGLTVPILALFLLAFAETPRLGAAPSSEFRWPLVLVRLEFAFSYLFAGVAKLLLVGWSWASAANIQGLVLSMALPGAEPPWAAAAAASQAACWAIGIGGMLMDFAVVGAVLRPRAALLLVPVLLVAHFAIRMVFGVLFLAQPLLFVFLDWDFLVARWRGASVDSAGAPG
jgi:hypothetical protein